MTEKKKFLLMGNPNVGKSVIFSKLTGVNVEISNYTGTTVDYTVGDINFGKFKSSLIDVPGTYSLQATSQAEDVAIKMLEEGADAIICVLDASHLSRNLDLALELKEYGIPIVYALNLTDVAKRQGTEIDVEVLSNLLSSPVIPTVAIKNIGLRKLLSSVFKESNKVNIPKVKLSNDERWSMIDEIVDKVEKKTETEESFIDKLENWTVEPWPGLPIALFVMIVALAVVVGGGKALRSVVLLPLVNNIIKPFFTRLVSAIIPAGIFRNLLVGEYGVLIIGIEWPFALIMPYVFLFYLVFSFLEDSGYLPRLGVLADGLLRKIGIQGGNIITIMMGYGCAVPAIIGTRAATTYKERLIVASLIAFAVPCASQTGAFISLLGDRSIPALIFVYLVSFLVMALVGFVLNKFIKGESQPMLLEVPNLLMPDKEAFKTKLGLRMKHFLLDAEGPMFIGIFIAALVAETGILNSFSEIISPIVVGWLGLPKEASLSLLLGIIRRELAVLPLLELNLNTLQLTVGSIVALFYLPCLSVFGVLMEEFSAKVALSIGALSIFMAIFFAGIVNQVANLILVLV